MIFLLTIKTCNRIVTHLLPLVKSFVWIFPRTAERMGVFPVRVTKRKEDPAVKGHAGEGGDADPTAAGFLLLADSLFFRPSGHKKTEPGLDRPGPAWYNKMLLCPCIN